MPKPKRISVLGRGDELLAARHDPRTPARLLRGQAGPRPLPGAFEVELDQVMPDPDQPRKDWDYDNGQTRLQQLAASVQRYGILQPLVVREGGELPDGRARYVIVNGGRRRAAAELAGLKVLPIVVKGAEGTRLRVLQLIENLQRADLSPLDEAHAYQELIDVGGYSPPSLAEELAISSQMIRERLRLLQDAVVADALVDRRINLTVARGIQQLPDNEADQLKARLAREEAVTTADLEVIRLRMSAEGRLNPRRKRLPQAVQVGPSETVPGMVEQIAPGQPARTPAFGGQVLVAAPLQAAPVESLASPPVVVVPTIPPLTPPGVPTVAVLIADELLHPAVDQAWLRALALRFRRWLPTEPPETRAALRERLLPTTPPTWWLALYPLLRESVAADLDLPVGTDSTPDGKHDDV